MALVNPVSVTVEKSLFTTLQTFFEAFILQSRITINKLSPFAPDPYVNPYIFTGDQADFRPDCVYTALYTSLQNRFTGDGLNILMAAGLR